LGGGGHFIAIVALAAIIKDMAKALPRFSRRYVVHGRVQGVGYRYFAQNWGNHIGVRGYVKNLDDGGVEVVATGTAAQLDELAGRLRQGPRFADVRGVEEQEAALLQSNGFIIKH
jgi:acylphosphatase